MARKSKAFDHSKYANWIDPASVTPYELNAKQHTDKQIKNIVNSINRFGWQQDVVITSDNVLVIGHGRRLAALQIGCEMPYHVIDKTADELTDEDIRELRIADNQTNAETGMDWDTLEAELADLSFDGFDFDFDFGGVDEDEPEDEAPDEYEEQKERKGSMAEKYLVPPFSVIYANRPDWLARKRAWVEKGLHSEIGRAGALAFNSKSDPEANFANRGGITTNDKSKAFKNNTLLNSYGAKRKHIATAY